MDANLDVHVRRLWTDIDGRDSDVERVFRHPEIEYLGELEKEFRDSPEDYRRWVTKVGLERLRRPESRTQLEQSLDQLLGQAREEKTGPHIVAEAMQVVANDLVLIEEMEKAGSLTRRELRERLTVEPGRVEACENEACENEATKLVERLIHNAARRVLAERGTRTPDPARVLPLRKKLAQGRHRINSEWQPTDEPALLVLTAGRGTRLRTTIPKALLPLDGQPILQRILDSAAGAGIRRVLMVLRYGARYHEPVFGGEHCYVIQDDAHGTGHSAAVGLHYLAAHAGPMIISYSDTPFLSTESFRRVLAPIAEGSADFSLLTVPATQEPDFGRLCKEGERITGIAQPRFGEAGSNEADAGLYAGRPQALQEALLRTENRNHRYEYSLTQVVRELAARDAWGGQGATIRACAAPEPISKEVLGINRPADYITARLLAGPGDTRSALEFFHRHATPSTSDQYRLRLFKALASQVPGTLFCVPTAEVARHKTATDPS